MISQDNLKALILFYTAETCSNYQGDLGAQVLAFGVSCRFPGFGFTVFC